MTVVVNPRRVQGYGWKPSLPDLRDQAADPSGIKVLNQVDPRQDYMTAIYDQLQLGACTSNTIVEAVDADRIVNGEQPFYASRLGIYALERLREGSPLNQDTGAFGRDGLWACQHVGMIPETDWPYSDQESEWSKDPRVVYGQHKGDLLKLERPYKAVARNINAMKAVLSNRQTIAFGFTVYESFESSEVAKTGVVPMPQQGEKVVGGHEVLLVGYLKSEPHYGLVRNHWSANWGIAGYFLMPWAYLTSNLCSDFRTIYRPAS